MSEEQPQETLYSRALALREMQVGALMIVCGVILILVGPVTVAGHLIPLSQLGSAAAGSGAGIIATGLLNIRFGKFFNASLRTISDRVMEATNLVLLQHSHLQYISSVAMSYQHSYWTTIDANGRCWKYRKINWRTQTKSPFLMASIEILDPDGQPRQYELLMWQTRGRIIISSTSAYSNEPAGIEIYNYSVESSELYGVKRHTTWVEKEAISAVILSTKPLLPDDGGAKLSDAHAAKLDEKWLNKMEELVFNTPEQKM